jgi:solute:Na+ symporter, SSS family
MGADDGAGLTAIGCFLDEGERWRIAFRTRNRIGFQNSLARDRRDFYQSGRLMITTYLGAGDWLVIVLYLGGILGFGIWFGHGQKSPRDYFLGGRSIPWWGVSLSIVATETSAVTFISVPALAYGGDLAFIQIIFGYVIARVILAVVMVPHYFQGEIFSPYQLFSRAFGPGTRRLAGLFFLLAGTLAAGVRVYVTCIPIKLMMGGWLESVFGDPIVGAILLFVVLSLIYTYAGGIKAVVWTDAVQFLLLLGGGLFALFYLPTLVEGGWSGALSQAANAGKLHWLNPKFGLSMPYNLWMGLIGATVMVMSTHGADQLIVQRILTCKSIRDGRKALILSAVIILPLFLLFLLVGVLLWVYYSQVAPAIPLPESTAGFKQNDYVFPVFILTAVPPVLKGLLVVAILSAAMSSVSSALSALASVSTMDLMKGVWKREHDDSFFLAFSRYSTLFWAGMLILVAWASRGKEFILNWAFSLNGLTNGALLGGLVLAIWWRRGRGLPVMAGMVTALLSMIFISQKAWMIGQGESAETFKIAWPWFTLIGSFITIAVSWALDRIARGTRREKPTSR